MESKDIRFAYFGSSKFSEIVLDELKKAGFEPALNIASSRGPLPSSNELKKLNADVFIVASFGKIIPKEILEIPKYGSLNVHPSLLPNLRGPSPIQNLILKKDADAIGVTIIKMDEEMDHGPIVAQEKVSIEPWPDHYEAVEEKLARAGGKLLVQILPGWIEGKSEATPQDDSEATFTRMIKTADAEIDLNNDAEENLRKVYAYSREPGAYINFKAKSGKDIRVKILDAKIEDGKFLPTKVVPAGKREMDWQSFLRGNA